MSQITNSAHVIWIVRPEIGIDRVIDMTIHGYRWHATAVGRAAVAAKDEKMAQWLRDAQQRRQIIANTR